MPTAYRSGNPHAHYLSDQVPPQGNALAQLLLLLPRPGSLLPSRIAGASLQHCLQVIHHSHSLLTVFSPSRGLWTSLDELGRCSPLQQHLDILHFDPLLFAAKWPKALSHGKYDGLAFPGRSPYVAKFGTVPQSNNERQTLAHRGGGRCSNGCRYVVRLMVCLA